MLVDSWTDAKNLQPTLSLLSYKLHYSGVTGYTRGIYCITAKTTLQCSLSGLHYHNCTRMHARDMIGAHKLVGCRHAGGPGLFKPVLAGKNTLYLALWLVARVLVSIVCRPVFEVTVQHYGYGWLLQEKNPAPKEYPQEVVSACMSVCYTESMHAVKI